MTPHTDAVAQVYARSLYELADQAGGQEKIVEVSEELEQICELARGDRAFREFLASPVIDQVKRGEVLDHIFENRVTDLALRFVLVLNQKGRLGHLEMIAAAFDQLVHAAFDRIEVDVYTAGSIQPDQLERIKSKIGAALNKEAVLYAYEDPGMIGGLTLRIGDQLIDGSVASRLRRIKRNLRASGGAGRLDFGERLTRFIEEGGDG